MNFFKHQDQARKRTGLLVFLLILAVICLVLTSVGAAAALFLGLQKGMGSNLSHSGNFQVQSFQELLLSPISFWIAALVSTAVLLGSVYKWVQLSSGGRAVAEALGGRLISADSNNPLERKILNVVEEMAIASGNPVPPVYVMEDTSINAFAAGYSRRDTVIGVTRGCITLLTREELQGVIAHEFSHIHNGDMRLNMRLTSILHGILVIGIIGYHISRNTAYSHRNRLDRAAMFGLIFIAIGYCGTFFGNIIKAAVSRQREFLADASSVQFTRNPAGISGALKKIGGLTQGSLLHSGAASEYSHMYFGQGIKTSFNALMATHPPLIERIKRIEPHWDGSYENPEMFKHQGEIPEPAASLDQVHQQMGFVQQATEFVGSPQPHHQEAAKILLSAIPQALHELAHNPFSARALVYALLLDKNSEVHSKQIAWLKQNAHPITFREIANVLVYVPSLPRALHLTLLELCLPAVKQFSQPQYQVFKKNLVALIQADDKISLFEWCLYRIVTHNYEASQYKPKFKLAELHEDISVIFSLIVYAGASPSPGGAFKAGVESLGIKNTSFKLSDERFKLQRIDQALYNLCQIKPLQKPILLKAIASIIGADGRVTIEEAELFRAIGDTLDCPIPPIII